MALSCLQIVRHLIKNLSSHVLKSTSNNSLRRFKQSSSMFWKQSAVFTGGHWGALGCGVVVCKPVMVSLHHIVFSVYSFLYQDTVFTRITQNRFSYGITTAEGFFAFWEFIQYKHTGTHHKINICVSRRVKTRKPLYDQRSSSPPP